MLSQTILEAAGDLAVWLQQRRWRIATAESCTAGGIGYAISAIAGSSEWLEGGFITYSNAMKQQQLHVSKACLNEFGAVSAETAVAMATGARLNSGADMAIAVTGVAGPAGGTAAKPVGLVWFGLATATQTLSWSCHFSGTRADIREATILEALRGFQKIS